MSTQLRNTKLAFGVEQSRSLFRLRLARYKALAEAVADYLKEKEPEKRQFALLDVGVGSGRSMRYIESESLSDRINFYGIDNSVRRLSNVYASHQWGLTRSDIEKGIPFKSALFDIVLFEQVLEHLVNPSSVIEEIARVLRPDGLLVVGVPIFPWGISHIRKLIVYISARWFGVTRSHLQAFDTMSIKSLVSANNRFNIRQHYGFRIVSGGLLTPLENFLWWYRFNRGLGRILPALCTEIQIIARRNPAL